MDPAMPLAQVPAHARRIEDLGYDGLHVAETTRDGLVAVALALEHTRKLVVRTAVTVAFARSPMMVAYQSWDFARSYPGRFELGLGSQVRANIVDRFSMPWSDPVSRMREYVQSLRAIFAAFQDGGGIDIAGEHYSFSRLQPYFNPGPVADPSIPIMLGAVGPQMVALAGEVAEGLLAHPTNSSPLYFEQVGRPALARGAGRVGRDPLDVAVVASPAVITGPSQKALGEARAARRRTLAFLLSTPAYRHTLDLLGEGPVQEELQELTRDGRWDRLDAVVTDDLLEELTLEATYDDLPARVHEHFRGRVQGVVIPPPEDAAHDRAFARVIEELQA